MKLELWNNLFQQTSVVLLGITFFVGAGALWTSKRLNVLQAERLIKLETDLAVQQERAANAERSLLELRDTLLNPRHLTAAGRLAMLAELRGHTGIFHVMCSRGGSPEPCEFTEEIMAVFIQAGWTTDRSFSLPALPAGVRIRVADSANPPETALIIQRALVAGGVAPVITSPIEGVGPDVTVAVTIGAKQ
jgi:hypothetical protein